MSDREEEPTVAGNGPQSIRLFGRNFTLPANRATRVSLGVVLIVGGVFGFLPILGFWMIPLGLIILSVDFAAVRRARRRTAVKWGRWRANGRTKDGDPVAGTDKTSTGEPPRG
ncbi:MAG: hypothetical protein V7704_21075 [Aurantimonas endophytica]|uniref:Uncharacterized protein n=1 Tax=Aurantimonas endophytica TaxID=1522175 RepID=A0A7W6MMX4_9HYPH|nr:hypothetical protein [Aurantimonas endophytica]MBB4001292.1 hypothetical protein [Aurantimonas endophytica]MCO6403064.1 hypothetical protein [Aurantimonas endophytica]